MASQLRELVQVLRDALGEPLLLMENGPQLVLLAEHPGRPELVLALVDRTLDDAVVTLPRGGVQQLADALNTWLEARP